MNNITYEEKNDGFKIEYLNDAFFDSLRNDYNGFNEWYKKSVNDKNKSSNYWIKNGYVIAFIGFKIEEENISIVNGNIPVAKRIKITTIKSNDNIPSFSEFVIYKAVRAAKIRNVDEIYFTIIPNTNSKQKLFKIAESYGFKNLGYKMNNGNKEYILIKNIKIKSDSWKKSYPQFPIGKLNAAAIIPMMDKYHDKYIQDARSWNTELERDYLKMGIQKAYVHSIKDTSNLEINTLAFIYRIYNGERKQYNSCITSYGNIVAQYKKGKHYSTLEEFKKLLKNKHAFINDDTELENWFKNKKYITVFALMQSFGVEKNINYKWLYENIFQKSIYIANYKFSLAEVKKIMHEGGQNV